MRGWRIWHTCVFMLSVFFLVVLNERFILLLLLLRRREFTFKTEFIVHSSLVLWSFGTLEFWSFGTVLSHFPPWILKGWFTLLRPVVKLTRAESWFLNLQSSFLFSLTWSVPPFGSNKIQLIEQRIQEKRTGNWIKFRRLFWIWIWNLEFNFNFK